MSENSKLNTESYKGVRDFYPEDLFVQNYIFGVWENVVESFGYEKYDASILESADLYKAKTGEEIVNEQTYTFMDRGGREVTLRPEMTPTVARMVAGREKELVFPLRWYSIPNLFRYEKPQKGRLREHWQLNVDLFGPDSKEADAEIITIAYEIMKKFGAKDEDFIIKINNRKIINDLYQRFGLSGENAYKVSKIIDKKDKIPKEIFLSSLSEVITSKAEEFAALLKSSEKLLDFVGKNENSEQLISLIDRLSDSGVKNIVFDPSLMRGFDYYTSIVFEVFDMSGDNRRSVFGGGRYDDLLDIFGAKKVPAIGFGAGDVTIRDFLETHNLRPEYKPKTDLYLCVVEESYRGKVDELARNIRDKGINVSVDLSSKKISDQLKIAHKKKIPYVICIGEDEVKTSLYPLKDMESGEEKKVRVEEIVNLIRK